MISAHNIISVVAVRFGIHSAADLTGPDRHKQVALARHVAMWLCRIRLEHSYPELGRAFGNRDHTTVMAAVRKVSKRMADDREFADFVNSLLDQVARPLVTTRRQQIEGIEVAS